jgi:diguanylate cyclase (GGDEF)-like protein
MDVQRILQFDLFKNVRADIIEELLSSHSVSIFQPGEYLITRFKDNKYLFLLLEGSVEIYLNENDKPLNIIERGESIGEISLLDGQPASAHVIALSECQVFMIDKEKIWSIAENSHAFTFNLLQHLVDRLRKFNAQVDSSIQAQQKMEKKATIDALTGLYNRRWFDDHFDTILNRCIDENQDFSFIMIDIDHFKHVNDQYGHAVGDVVLHKTGAILLEHARERDAAVRYGGEELSLILPNTTLEQALVIAERIRKVIEKTDFQYSKDEKLNITVSIGCSTYTGSEDKNRLMKLADDALYLAKDNGRNQVRTKLI